MWWSDDEIWTTDKAFALANFFDPLTHHNLGPGDPGKNLVQLGKSMRL
jgi:hypothetical protein